MLLLPLLSKRRLVLLRHVLKDVLKKVEVHHQEMDHVPNGQAYCVRQLCHSSGYTSDEKWLFYHVQLIR